MKALPARSEAAAEAERASRLDGLSSPDCLQTAQAGRRVDPMGFWVFSKTAVTAVHPIYLILDRVSIDYITSITKGCMQTGESSRSPRSTDVGRSGRLEDTHAAHACILPACTLHDLCKNSPPSAPQQHSSVCDLNEVLQ